MRTCIIALYSLYNPIKGDKIMNTTPLRKSPESLRFGDQPNINPIELASRALVASEETAGARHRLLADPDRQLPSSTNPYYRFDWSRLQAQLSDNRS